MPVSAPAARGRTAPATIRATAERMPSAPIDDRRGGGERPPVRSGRGRRGPGARPRRPVAGDQLVDRAALHAAPRPARTAASTRIVSRTNRRGAYASRTSPAGGMRPVRVKGPKSIAPPVIGGQPEAASSSCSPHFSSARDAGLPDQMGGQPHVAGELRPVDEQHPVALAGEEHARWRHRRTGRRRRSRRTWRLPLSTMAVRCGRCRRASGAACRPAVVAMSRTASRVTGVVSDCAGQSVARWSGDVLPRPRSARGRGRSRADHDPGGAVARAPDRAAPPAEHRRPRHPPGRRAVGGAAAGRPRERAAPGGRAGSGRSSGPLGDAVRTRAPGLPAGGRALVRRRRPLRGGLPRRSRARRGGPAPGASRCWTRRSRCGGDPRTASSPRGSRVRPATRLEELRTRPPWRTARRCCCECGAVAEAVAAARELVASEPLRDPAGGGAHAGAGRGPAPGRGAGGLPRAPRASWPTSWGWTRPPPLRELEARILRGDGAAAPAADGARGAGPGGVRGAAAVAPRRRWWGGRRTGRCSASASTGSGW